MECEGSEPKVRVICLLDVDCFEVQVYDNIYPQYKNWPRVVINRGPGGRIVAVSYEAKAFGITRSMNVTTALEYCPDLKIIAKESRWGKPDTMTPRHASWEILDRILGYCRGQLQDSGHEIPVEYSSLDEFFLDFTDVVEYRIKHKERYPLLPKHNFHLEGGTKKYKGPGIVHREKEIYPLNYKKYANEERLIFGGYMAHELCKHIYKTIGYQASAGISSNKLLAKLGCPLHKPGAITVFPKVGLERINWRIMIEDVPGLGGLIGQKIKYHFNVCSLRDLSQIQMSQLRELFGIETATRVYDLGQGICDDAVGNKIMKDEVSVSKTNIGRAFLNNSLLDHIYNLVGEMMERLHEEKYRNKRATNYLQVKCEFAKKDIGSCGFTFDITTLKTIEEISEKAFQLLTSDSRTEINAIINLRLTAKNFCPHDGTENPYINGDSLYDL